MSSSNVFSRALDCQKTLFNNSFAVMAAFQEQHDRIMDVVVAENRLLPKAGKQMYVEWSEFARKNRKGLKMYMDVIFDTIRNMSPPSGPSRPLRAGSVEK